MFAEQYHLLFNFCAVQGPSEGAGRAQRHLSKQVQVAWVMLLSVEFCRCLWKLVSLHGPSHGSLQIESAGRHYTWGSHTSSYHLWGEHVCNSNALVWTSLFCNGLSYLPGKEQSLMQIQRRGIPQTIPAGRAFRESTVPWCREKDELHGSLEPQRNDRYTHRLFGHCGTGLVNAWAIWRKFWVKAQRRRWLILDRKSAHWWSALAALAALALKLLPNSQSPLPQELEKFKALQSVERFCSALEGFIEFTDSTLDLETRFQSLLLVLLGPLQATCKRQTHETCRRSMQS